MSLHLKMTSKKQHIRLWFECFKICKSLPEYSENLHKSIDFYEEWGEVADIKFDDWWKERKQLFEDLYVKEVSKVSRNPNTITISIPLTENITKIGNEVKRIVKEKQLEKLKEQGKYAPQSKSNAVGAGKYSFSQKELKGVIHHVNLEIYKLYLRLGKPPINRNFLIKIREEFESRPRSKLKNSIIQIPSIDQFNKRYTDTGSVDDIVRTIRRGSIKGVEKTLLNVSRGTFP
jgi:hypothetical protein